MPVAAPRWHADPRRWRALFVAALVVTLVLALRPVAPHEPWLPHLDKLRHLAAFAVLWTLGAWGALRAWPLAVGLLAFGGAIELLQGLTATREASWGDWVADAAGLAVGHVIASRWSPLAARAG